MDFISQKKSFNVRTGEVVTAETYNEILDTIGRKVPLLHQTFVSYQFDEKDLVDFDCFIHKNNFSPIPIKWGSIRAIN